MVWIILGIILLATIVVLFTWSLCRISAMCDEIDNVQDQQSAKR